MDYRWWIDRAARPARACRHDAPGSLPRFRRGLAHTRRFGDRRVREVGFPARRRFLRCRGSGAGRLPFIAEDLGLITPDVMALRDRYSISRACACSSSPSTATVITLTCPSNYVHNTVVYTRSALTTIPPRAPGSRRCRTQQRQNMWNCLKRHTGVSGDVAPALIQLAWGSAAGLAIAPLQDPLNLGSDARMNQPGQAEGNWQWRCTEAMLTPAVWQWLCDLTLAPTGRLLLPQNPGPI